MAASSVTGTGPGESFGLRKPNNQCTCGCCADPSTSKTPPKKIGCKSIYVDKISVVNYSQNSNIDKTNNCF